MVTLVPSMLRWSVEERKPGARFTEPSVARMRRSTSRCWLAGSTVKTFISVTMLLLSEMDGCMAGASLDDLCGAKGSRNGGGRAKSDVLRFLSGPSNHGDGDCGDAGDDGQPDGVVAIIAVGD